MWCPRQNSLRTASAFVESITPSFVPERREAEEELKKMRGKSMFDALDDAGVSEEEGSDDGVEVSPQKQEPHT